jgi:hypothetical protein
LKRIALIRFVFIFYTDFFKLMCKYPSTYSAMLQKCSGNFLRNQPILQRLSAF